MGVRLPNGITYAIATAFAAALTVTAASNASECVATVTNTLAAGDFVEFTSGWSRANGKVFRVKSPTGSSIVLEGFNTLDTGRFPAGSGVGTIRKVNTWTQLQQVVNWTSSGGEPQYTTYSFLEDDFDRQIPSNTSAQTLSFEVADDPSLPGYQAVKVAAEDRSLRPLKGTFPDNSLILYNGYFAFDETPTQSKGNIMTCKGGVALANRPVRYSA